MKFEKDETPNTHSITSKNVLVDEETGRVVAVFYNDYDLDAVLELQAKKEKAESELSWSDDKIREMYDISEDRYK